MMAATLYQRIWLLLLPCSLIVWLPTASSFSLPLQKSAKTTKPAAVVVFEEAEEEKESSPKQAKTMPHPAAATAAATTIVEANQHRDMRQQQHEPLEEEENWLDKMVQATKSNYLQNEPPQHNNDDDKNIIVNNNNSSSSSNSSDANEQNHPLLHVLAQQGPWTAYFDESEASMGLIYYFHQETGESRWSRPTETFPVVTLSERLQKIAHERQRAHLEKQKMSSSSSNGVSSRNTKNEKTSSKQKGSLLAAKVVAALKNSKMQKQKQACVRERSDMPPLATEGDWEAHLDAQNTGFVYYWNKITGQSQWTPPTLTFPALDGYPQRPMHEMISQATTTTTAADTTHSRSLATQGDWTAYFDGDKTYMVYYFNHKTGVSQWEEPSPNFPRIRWTERMRQRMLREQPVPEVVVSTQDGGRRPLAKQDNWVAYFDSNTMRIYYVNSATGARQWDKPTANFPTVRLPNRMKKLMQQQQQVIEAEKYEQPGFLTWLVDTVSRHVAEERAGTKHDDDDDDDKASLFFVSK